MRHGLSECKYIYNNIAVKMPAAVNIELNPKTNAVFGNRIRGGERQIRYENIGYDGRLELAALPYDFIRDIFGWEIDEYGSITEIYRNTVKPAEFMLMYQTKETAGGGERTVLFCCTADKPQIQAETDGKSINVKSVSFNIYVRRDNMKRIKKTAYDPDSEDYRTWFGYKEGVS